ncbi:hypothetical protein I4F81_010254 [Pyropia yezoensis]|uniref:Uncharacterized protein n=1 Tax=Pyropia yezoensis TaxID=2788 RepID=A0ACC3CD45_PYRYE|nr:hypothetical protein I4F81_010254 [Neopyropia yezoensis]
MQPSVALAACCPPYLPDTHRRRPGRHWPPAACGGTPTAPHWPSS